MKCLTMKTMMKWQNDITFYHSLLRGLYIVCCLNREAHFLYKSSIIHSFMINDKQVNVHIYTYNMYLS